MLSRRGHKYQRVDTYHHFYSYKMISVTAPESAEEGKGIKQYDLLELCLRFCELKEIYKMSKLCFYASVAFKKMNRYIAKLLSLL